MCDRAMVRLFIVDQEVACSTPLGCRRVCVHLVYQGAYKACVAAPFCHYESAISVGFGWGPRNCAYNGRSYFLSIMGCPKMGNLKRQHSQILDNLTSKKRDGYDRELSGCVVNMRICSNLNAIMGYGTVLVCVLLLLWNDPVWWGQLRLIRKDILSYCHYTIWNVVQKVSDLNHKPISIGYPKRRGSNSRCLRYVLCSLSREKVSISLDKDGNSLRAVTHYEVKAFCSSEQISTQFFSPYN
jgi:hypothetical protein